MCFGPSGPSQAEIEAAQAQRDAAAEQKRAQIEERADQKRDDIETALEGSVTRDGRRGGVGRRSLMTAPSGSGYSSRF